MPLMTPYLLLVLTAFLAFMIVLLAVSLRCWGMKVPRRSAPEISAASEANPAPLRKAA